MVPREEEVFPGSCPQSVFIVIHFIPDPLPGLLSLQGKDECRPKE
jgi:hypothetical protein